MSLLLRPSGILGFNELGDFVAAIAGFLATILGFLFGATPQNPISFLPPSS